jgi:hypothetical protein
LKTMKAFSISIDNPPLPKGPKGRRFLPDLESPSMGSCYWPHSSRAHFTSDPGLAGPWVLHKLGVRMQELGYCSLKDSIERCIRSLHPRPEGRAFPRITGKIWPSFECGKMKNIAPGRMAEPILYIKSRSRIRAEA